MTFEKFLFYLFAAVLLFAAVMVITRRNPVHSVLFLVLAFFNAAGLWLLLEAEFLAITLVLVYVGAVMVLFLFVVMMLDIDLAAMRAGFMRYLPVGLAVAVLVAAEMAVLVGPEYFGLERYAEPARRGAEYSNTADLGGLLYTVYMYQFEIAAVILLVAIVAAIGLTLRRRPDSRYQEPSTQVTVRRRNRVRLVKMDSEGRPTR
jgi:NADH-quinone oxidoreductase subunit J